MRINELQIMHEFSFSFQSPPVIAEGKLVLKNYYYIIFAIWIHFISSPPPPVSNVQWVCKRWLVERTKCEYSFATRTHTSIPNFSICENRFFLLLLRRCAFALLHSLVLVVLGRKCALCALFGASIFLRQSDWIDWKRKMTRTKT